MKNAILGKRVLSFSPFGVNDHCLGRKCAYPIFEGLLPLGT